MDKTIKETAPRACGERGTRTFFCKPLKINN